MILQVVASGSLRPSRSHVIYNFAFTLAAGRYKANSHINIYSFKMYISGYSIHSKLQHLLPSHWLYVDVLGVKVGQSTPLSR